MFPYSLVGRPFPLAGFRLQEPLPHQTPIGICSDIAIRQEFFGAIAFRQYANNPNPYGSIIYLNHAASRLLGSLSAFGSMETLRANIGKHGLSEEQLEEFIQKCLFLDLLSVQPPFASPPQWDVNVWKTNFPRLSAPLRLYVNLTERCNLACKHCYANIKGKAKQLKRDLVESILDQARDLVVPTMVLIGGEPLLYPDFPDLIKGAIQRGLSIFTNTNGLLLTQTRSRELKEAGLRIISVSLDGADPGTHDAIRGQGKFARTLRAIQDALAEGLQVSLSTTLTSLTIDQVDRFFDLCVPLGVHDYHFMVIAPVGKGKEDAALLPSREQIYALRERIEDRLRLHPHITVNCTSVIDPQLIGDWQRQFAWSDAARYVYRGCEAGRFRLEIGFDGSIIPCILLSAEPFRAGTADQDKIGEVWRNSELLRALGQRPSEREDEKCWRCVGNEFCRGGCRGVIYAHFGSLGHRDPTCKG